MQSESQPRQPSVSYSETLTIEPEKPTIAKAVIAGVTSLGAALTTALADNGITATEWVTIIVGTAVAVASVWAVTNKRS